MGGCMRWVYEVGVWAGIWVSTVREDWVTVSEEWVYVYGGGAGAM